ncbi:alpha/beta fold hydrolase [Dyadobacter psychrotolerans]|uniref:Alpha/beta hydrolase n=1 Tax=Dyadobacter psychrotolerans TaxID=2541721 RepID=A0A4R5DU44_9BACT|nr:alpha/beta hydrolase [Dyadobacter psychrotolerans]TDE14705.1 alpha/beta hydrolase [Dyadobacter psychrotolerans]
MDILQRNNVTLLGEGIQPMIFAHGFGCAQHMWRDVWPAFSKDYRIVLFDYVGSGGSDIDSYNPERYANLNGYAQDILDICKTLDLKDAVLVGHSVSSMIGILAAIKEPSFFKELILIGPSPRYINDGNYHGGFEKADIDELLQTMEKNFTGWANFLAPAMMKNQDRPGLSEELAESFCSVNRAIAKQFAGVTFYSDNRRDLAKLKHPSLIMQCTDDIIAPLEVGAYLHENLAGSTFRLMQATGHCPHMSAPDETIQIMKQYLQPLT